MDTLCPFGMSLQADSLEFSVGQDLFGRRVSILSDRHSRSQDVGKTSQALLSALDALASKTWHTLGLCKSPIDSDLLHMALTAKSRLLAEAQVAVAAGALPRDGLSVVDLGCVRPDAPAKGRGCRNSCSLIGDTGQVWCRQS